MALKVLMLRKKIDDKNKELAELRKKSESFAVREAEIETAIAEAETQEERDAVDASIAEFDTEKAENDASIASLENEVRELENELNELESADTAVRADETKKTEEVTRKVNVNMSIRFAEMSREERSAIVNRDEVKSFLERARTIGAEKRSVSGADLFIPVDILDLVRKEVERESKLIGFVRFRSVSGTARQNIEGAIPEAVWTEMCANLNELNIGFNQIEVDGYKVGGYIAICNAVLEDSDENLAAAIISALGGAIGKAIDMAILFGTGTKMPIGIASRLAETSQPSYWGVNYPTWTDLHESNVLTLNIDASTGETFFASLIAALGVARPVYSADGLFWVMNRKTHMKILAKALNFNAQGALLAGVNNVMPIIGGTIVEFEDDRIQDNEIIGGFGGNYLFVEREGAKFGSSDQVFYLNDQTVFKGTGRYDGQPISGEAFVVVNFNNTAPTTTHTFETDYANEDMNFLTVTAAAGTASGDTVLTVSNTKAQSGAVLKYKAKASADGIHVGDKVSGFTALTSGTTQITAAAGTPIAVVELDASNRVISIGQVASVPKT